MIRPALRLFVLLALLAALGLTSAGCGPGLPEDILKDAKNLEKSLEETGSLIKRQKDKFSEIRASNDFSPLAPYAEREKWADAFGRASQMLDRAKGLYASELTPLLKQNTPEAAPLAKVQIKRIRSAVQDAKSEARKPFDRMERIRSAMTDTGAIYTAARKDGDAILSGIARINNGPVSQAIEKFPDAADKITARFSPLAKLADTTRAALTTLEYQYQAHQASREADYAAFINAADTLTRNREEEKKQGAELETDLGQLYKSYTKVLQDMKVDYYVTVKRESWDENSDYYDPRTATFTRKISPATYEALADTPLDSIADITPSFGRVSFKNHIGGTWEALGIKPTDNWPSRYHNAATFWIEDTREDYFHKYLQETDGKTEETGWIKVNPSFYEQNFNNLGMAILSKPYGEFEPDTMAAPPGMAYVGNPEYGEWKKDDSGNSFWSWYGRYAFFSNLFFFPPSYYYYGSWNRWRTGYRHQKPYYGRTDSGTYTYGTRGTATRQSPRYQNTTFSKTGGLKTAPASVRGGGSSLRGGGPKTKGK